MALFFFVRAIFEAFVRYTRIPEGGYSGLRDVRNNLMQPGAWSNWNNKMESFFLVGCLSHRPSVVFRVTVLVCVQAETLKYLYLLFSPGKATRGLRRLICVLPQMMSSPWTSTCSTPR